MTSRFLGLCVLATFVLSSCAATETADSSSTTTPATTSTSSTSSTSTTTSSTLTPNTSDGTISIRLEPVNGVFIEGFEIGIRIETGDGEVLFKTLWSDYIASLGDTNIRAYYDSVLTQEQPAGPVVVLATVNVGAGPAPVTPDIDGPLNCQLKVDLPPAGQIEVEISFNGTSDCVRQIV